MGWTYQFVDLTDAQKQERRELLDKYAWLAQESALVSFLAINCFFFLSWLSRRRQNLGTPDSPRRKEERLGHHIAIARVKVIWGQLSWWCGEPVEGGNFYLGLRGEVLATMSWLAWLLVLCVLETGEGKILKCVCSSLVNATSRLPSSHKTLRHRSGFAVAHALFPGHQITFLASSNPRSAFPRNIQHLPSTPRPRDIDSALPPRNLLPELLHPERSACDEDQRSLCYLRDLSNYQFNCSRDDCTRSHSTMELSNLLYRPCNCGYGYTTDIVLSRQSYPALSLRVGGHLYR